MVCGGGGFTIQRHNELRDLEANMLSMVCNDVEIKPILQELTGESLPRGANRAPDARLDIYARGFWERKSQRSSMYRYVTPTLILTETWTPSRYTSSTRTT